MTLETIMQAVTNNLGLLLFIAVLGEAITEALKALIPVKFQGQSTYFLSMAVGIALVFIFKLNLFGLVGNAMTASMFIVGILVGRGSNYVNGFLKRIGVIQGSIPAGMFGGNVKR